MTSIPLDRPSGTATTGSKSDLDAQDLAYGQFVIVTARWILVAAGLVLALWLAESVSELRIKIPVILLLAVGNFYLHAQLLRKRPVIDAFAYGASAADLVVITLLVASEGGFNSGLYIFYFPALLGISLAFPTALTLGYTAVVVTVYGLMAMGTSAPADMDVIITRLLMFASMGVCGTLYWRTERSRRVAAAEAQTALAADVGAR